MSKERLEELKGVLESWGAWSDWNEAQRKVLKDLACSLERVQELENEINTHEPHGRNYTNEQHVQLRERLQKLEEKHKEYVSFTESNNYNMDIEFEKLYKQNKCYREALEEIVEYNTSKFPHASVSYLENIANQALAGDTE